MSLAINSQSLTPGTLVELFRFDATSVGGSVYYFAQAANESDGVSFGGVYYPPVDVEFTDMETNGKGSLPTPHIKIANTNGVFQSLVNTYGDMLGCELRRVRTFRQYLDDGSSPDPTAYYGPDVFRVERKVSENPIFIEWELSSSIDQEGKMIPGRPVIRDTCLWRYRHWNGTSWDYSKAQCPYTDSQCYTRSGVPTTPNNDVCARNLSACELRFGKGNPLPFGGFPGVSRSNG